MKVGKWKRLREGNRVSPDIYPLFKVRSPDAHRGLEVL